MTLKLTRVNRWHAALHLAWAQRGGPAPWICRLLVRLGAFQCDGNESNQTTSALRPRRLGDEPEWARPLKFHDPVPPQDTLP